MQLNAAAQALLAASLALPAVQPVAAQVAPEEGSVSLKYLDYLDSQPGAKRVRIRAPALSAVVPVAGQWLFSGTLISDAISGASPAYHTRAISPLTDERNAGDVAVTRYFDGASLSVGANYSKESDYIGRGVSLRYAFSSDDRNTTWSAGVALGRDSIAPVNRAVLDESKRRSEWLLGVSQVLTPVDIVQINLGHQRASGYLSDPYKFFDERPRQRRQNTLALRWNHHVDAIGATLRTSYRYFRDSFGIRAHTLGAEWVQPLAAWGGGWTITPSFRLYSQSAASFYVDASPDFTSPFPPNPPDDALVYSEDQRLSAFGGRTLGLKVARQLPGGWTVDLKVERYVQRGSWRWFGSGSPNLAEFRARSVLVGVSKAF